MAEQLQKCVTNAEMRKMMSSFRQRFIEELYKRHVNVLGAKSVDELADYVEKELESIRSDLKIKPGAIKIWLYDLLTRELPDKSAALMIANAVAEPLARRINDALVKPAQGDTP